MSGIILCNDIIEMIGKDVKKIREKDTLDYYMDIWEKTERYRGWSCLLTINLSNFTSITPSPREFTLIGIEQIGSKNFIVSDRNLPLTLKNKIEAVNYFKQDINLRWIDYNCYLEHDYMTRINNNPPRISITIDEDDGDILFVY